ncbi:LLM class flavin-dependent oxidoreductase [Paenibacillus pabuli]|uniref:LLM class flavin-dependent oxidoreductase n=1 Tax=Paenibacillus pabuli TaxID=1472 RepID=UPI003CE8C03C
MEYGIVLNTYLPISYQELFDYNVSQTVRAEKYNFNSVLVSSMPLSFDPWTLGIKIGLATEKIRIIVAHNTAMHIPTYSSKVLNSANALLNNRVDINLVTGSSSWYLAEDSLPASHVKRYERTKEFIEVMRKLRNGSCSYTGEYFQFNNCNIYPEEDKQYPAGLFISGSSEEAMNIASKYADYYLLFPEHSAKIKEKLRNVKQLAQQNQRDIKCGMVINIISHSDSNEAWKKAESMLNALSPVKKKFVKMYLSNSDSVGVKNNLRFINDEEPVEPYIWSGFSKISTSIGLSIVGNYQEVITAIKRYAEAGVEYFLFANYNDDSEIERIGEYVLPYL